MIVHILQINYFELKILNSLTEYAHITYTLKRELTNEYSEKSVLPTHYIFLNSVNPWGQL